ncbi:hypothetical protein Y032_0451g1695 [Ancylostoma ceylanicum]|uniref:Uncharacterized protein n=1 Tax=Ancylostoma ceylanicum TaxID=53326 RepID=A0A016WZR0_9BILA|nr:hypothetical protein Y032_0451g1695 [Ancylostoma ceylanicum]
MDQAKPGCVNTTKKQRMKCNEAPRNTGWTRVSGNAAAAQVEASERASAALKANISYNLSDRSSSDEEQHAPKPPRNVWPAESRPRRGHHHESNQRRCANVVTGR